MKSFDSLTEREILALAISLEEEDERVYSEYAEGLREKFSGLRRGFRRHARGGIGAPPPADRAVS